MAKPISKTQGEILRDLREGAGLSQRKLSELMSYSTKISRETIIAIEGDDPATIKALKIVVVNNWYDVCDPDNNRIAAKGFHAFFKKVFRIP